MRLVSLYSFCLLISAPLCLQAQQLCVKGQITDAETKKPLAAVSINSSAISDKQGNYTLIITDKKKKISFSMMGYEGVNCDVHNAMDTLVLNIKLTKKAIELAAVDVASPGMDTVFGNKKFSVADYEFLEDKLILLTFEKKLSHAKVMLADASQKILSTVELPDEASKLYKDYLGYINVICSTHIYRINVKNNAIRLASLPFDDYKKLIMPCLDTIGSTIYFSNYQREYPEFKYYAYNTADSSVSAFKTVCDREGLKGYNMEYYFLKPKERLVARKLADEYGVDKYLIAATMSGLTSSMFYNPLYAPLMVIKDTVFVFDHHADAIFKYDKKQHLLDSIHIDYHHPKNWRDWKRQVIVDTKTGKIYSVYQKCGFWYLKQIDSNTGKIIASFKLSGQYAEKIKVSDNEVYYIYRPFESLQEQFVYKESLQSYK